MGREPQTDTVEYLNKRIEEFKIKHGLQKDSFLRKCFSCYCTWRNGFVCQDEQCKQTAWCIDYDDFVEETK